MYIFLCTQNCWHPSYSAIRAFTGSFSQSFLPKSLYFSKLYFGHALTCSLLGAPYEDRDYYCYDCHRKHNNIAPNSSNVLCFLQHVVPAK